MSSSIPPPIRDARGVSNAGRRENTTSINIHGHEFSINWTNLSRTKKIGAVALLVLSAPLIVPAVAGFSIGYYGRKGVEKIISKIFKENQDSASPSAASPFVSSSAAIVIREPTPKTDARIAMLKDQREAITSEIANIKDQALEQLFQEDEISSSTPSMKEFYKDTAYLSNSEITSRVRELEANLSEIDSALESLDRPETKEVTEQQLALNEIADLLTKNEETSKPTNIAGELNNTIANNEQILLDMPRSRDIVVNGEVKKTGYNYENEVRELGLLLGKDASEKSIQKLTAFFSQQLSGAEVALSVVGASNGVPVRYAPATHFLSYEKEGENINVNAIFAFNISHNQNAEGNGLIEPSLWAIATYSLPIEELKADKPFESIQQRIIFIPRNLSNETINETKQKNLTSEEMLLNVDSPEGQALKEDRSEQSRVMTSKVYYGFISDLEKAAHSN